MNPPETKDPLDALLREQNAYIEDDGFTARVVAGLPRRHASMRRAVLLTTTAIGYWLALRWMPWGLLSPSVLLLLNAQALLAYGVLIAIGCSLIWGLVAAFGEES